MSYVPGHAADLPLEDASADLALMFLVWHHVPDRPAAAAELARVLAPGARLLMATTLADRLKDLLLYRYFPRTRDIDAEVFPTLEETVRVFADAGFVHAGLTEVHHRSADSLAEYAGRVVLVVNTASQCGFTPQYEGLQKLWEKYGEQGFVILGFPCDQFGHQEPGSEDEIGAFCQKNYGVTFPMMSKIEVNGPDRHQLYRLLAGEGAEFPGDITWNFEKFLLGKDGRVLARFSPRTPPDDPSIIQAIEKALS